MEIYLMKTDQNKTTKNRPTLEKMRNISLRYKIAWMILSIVLFLILLFGILLSVHYNRTVEQRSKKHIEESIQFMSKQINQVFSDGVLCTNYLTLSINSIEDELSSRQVDRDNQLLSILSQTILMFDGIDSILFVDRAEQLYATNMAYHHQKMQILSSSYMKELSQVNNGKTLLFDIKDTCMQTNDSKPLVTMGKKVVDIRSGVNLGYLFINIDGNTLEESIQNQISFYLLLDTEGNCVAGTQHENLLKALQEKCGQVSDLEKRAIRYQGEKYLVAQNLLEDCGWSVFGITNLNEYNVTTKEMAKVILFSGFVTVVLMILLIIILSNILTKPLVQLEQGAEKIAQGDMSIRFHFRTQDEIGKLGKIFNDMVVQIETLIQTAEEAGKKKREYELALIQEQVKPHFLYNTLDIIIILIDMGKPRDAHRATKKLADYYKNSLSSSEDVVSLEKEFQITEDYLDVQMIRYGDKFSYEIDAQDADTRFMLPKMTLQPLVENALYHGLKYQKGWGTIHISAKWTDNEMLLEVSDNGIGMRKEKLTELLQENKPHKHFGIYSVDHRLKLYYGEGYYMEIQSEYEKGTQIFLHLPKKPPAQAQRDIKTEMP